VTSLYLDVHVPAAVANQLRRLGVDVHTAREDSAAELSDAALLKRAAALGRLLFTQDIRFKSLAEDWQRTGQPFAGLVFGHQLHGSIGQYVRDLELIAKATQPSEWWCQIERLPLR
jgi:hypothetical protein